MAGKKKRGSHLIPRDAAGMEELRKLANTPAAKAKAAATRKRNAEILRAAKAAGASMMIPGAERAVIENAIAASNFIGPIQQGKRKRNSKNIFIGPVEDPRRSKARRIKLIRAAQKRVKAGQVAVVDLGTLELPKPKKTHAKKTHAKKTHAKKTHAKKTHAKKTHRHAKRHHEIVGPHKSARALGRKGGRKCEECGRNHTLRQHWSHFAKPTAYNYRRATKSGRPHKGRSRVGLLGYIFG